MNHNIDISSINTRTDLAVEQIDENDKNKYVTITDNENINVYELNIDDKNKNIFNKNIGKYITIEFNDITDYNNNKEVEKVFVKELNKILEINNIKKNDKCMIIGLGNERSTPDSLGPKTINNIIVTNHFFNMGINVEDGFRCVSALNPGVMGQTGIETSNIVLSVAKEIKPDFIIVVDALKASNVNKVNKNIQITDAGINPGSGIGNTRKEISKDILGIPVIAIGVPTVVDTITIVTDTFNYLQNYFYHMKKNFDKPKEKLKIVRTNIEKGKLTKEEMNKMFGLLGSISIDEFRTLIGEAINPIGYNMIVTPKEIDFIIEKLSLLISSGLNNVLHEKVNYIN